MDQACAICGRQAAVDRIDPDKQTSAVRCAHCGGYVISDIAISALTREVHASRFRAVLSEWVDNQNSNGVTPTITGTKLDELRQVPILPFIERAKRLLILVADRTQRLGQVIDHTDPKIAAKLQAVDPGEVAFISDFLRGQGWLEDVAGLALTGGGAIRADEWKQAASSSMQVFVAMWFDESMAAAWTHGLEKGISDAGYRAVRIDRVEHVNDITDEIIAQIRRSRFVVADYTGHRGGVYYEAGYAAGRDLQVIPTCRKDQIDGLHFDVRQFNCIDWETPDDLARRLQVRIEAVIGDGPLKKIP